MSLPTLPNRVTVLAVALLSFNGQDLIGSWKTYKHNFDITTQEGKTSSSRYDKKQPVKRKRSFSLSVFLNKTGTTRGTNLDITAWSVGGTSRIGDLKNASVTITTKTAEGSGARDFDQFPVCVGTGMEIQATEFISSSADLIALGSQSTTISDFELAVIFTVAGVSFQAPMLLSAGSHTIEGEQIQMQDVTLTLRGAITSPTVGITTGAANLLGLIATGTSALQYSVDTGATVEIGYALITKATFNVQDSQIIENNFDFEGQGTGAES